MIPVPLILARAIRRRVRALGSQIASDFLDRVQAERPVTMLTLMDGAFCFTADLARATPLLELKLQFVRVRSYHAGTTSSGSVEHESLPRVSGDHVIIVDDILDSGRTLATMCREVQRAGAASVTTCVLLDKPSRRVAEGLSHASYTGFTIADQFVVGYGLDLNGRWRHLPDVCIYEPNSSIC